MRKFKASGSTGLAEALAAALSRSATDGSLNPHVVQSRPRAGKQLAADKWVKENRAVVIPATAPVPLLERRKREENGNRITKHCAVIKRIEPRLLMELLQDFGSIEGLSVPKQEELLKRLERIRKDYRI